MLNEADTCRILITHKLKAALWDDDQIREQISFTDGRIVAIGNHAKRKTQRRADYILRYSHDYPIAVVEAKAENVNAFDGLQQAKLYAEMLGVKFAYASNGHTTIEHNYLTGETKEIDSYPSPDELWRRLNGNSPFAAENAKEQLLTPARPKNPLRYYQEIAINRAVEAILTGQKRILLTLATGTGKTPIAAQIAYNLWASRWNIKGRAGRRPKILFLADRNFLVDDPYSKHFAMFGEARHKIQREVNTSRDMYFAIYQAVDGDEWNPGLYREYPADFFDLILVDECHRGSSKEESNWREILNYFGSAVQLGMTATPLRDDNRDTYAYFGNPLYIYSLKQGIEDGFLAPYRVHRVVSNWDLDGFRPDQGALDRYGREIPDELYTTQTFERNIALKSRTRAFARHLSKFMQGLGDRFAKTIVFCVDQEHAAEMALQMQQFNQDLMREYPDYVVRITGNDKEIGRGHLDNFADVEKKTPVVVTTSQLLTTGVDIPTCRIIAIARTVNSMVEFKQMIGRGTRVRDDYGKLFFDILDYTGSAVARFADPEFDGFPALATLEEIDEAGQVRENSEQVTQPEETDETSGMGEPAAPFHFNDERYQPRKYYYDGGYVEIVASVVYDLDPNGNRLRVVRYSDYTAEVLHQMYTTAADLRSKWSDAQQRAAVIEALEARGISFEHLAQVLEQPEADPFDLLCNVAFQAPIRSRKERADFVRREQKKFFEKFSPEAREILNEILDKYVESGIAQFKMPEIFKLPPLVRHGNAMEISRKFGTPQKLTSALNHLQAMIYAA
jgi:type I restriction enzyme R subunit